jgi:hypothetical protein
MHEEDCTPRTSLPLPKTQKKKNNRNPSSKLHLNRGSQRLSKPGLLARLTFNLLASIRAGGTAAVLGAQVDLALGLTRSGKRVALKGL